MFRKREIICTTQEQFRQHIQTFFNDHGHGISDMPGIESYWRKPCTYWIDSVNETGLSMYNPPPMDWKYKVKITYDVLGYAHLTRHTNYPGAVAAYGFVSLASAAVAFAMGWIAGWIW